MIWLSKVFGDVISFGSGQIVKDLKVDFLLGRIAMENLINKPYCG